MGFDPQVNRQGPREGPLFIKGNGGSKLPHRFTLRCLHSLTRCNLLKCRRKFHATRFRPIYVQMAVDSNRNPRRPFDMAVSDYYHNGNDLLWKKHLGDQEKPKNWDMGYYAWYFTKPERQGKRRTSAIKGLLTSF